MLGGKQSQCAVFRALAPYVISSLSLAYFLFVACSNIRIPGLHYDETLFVNAATGGLKGDFIFRRVLGIPVMLMPYIGALKAYVYYPIFRVAGVSPETIRYPTIFISVISLLVIFAIWRNVFGSWIAAFAVVLVGTDPAFIFVSKIDFGPVVLMLLFKLLAVYFFLKLVLTSSTRYLWLSVLACALGVFDKLDFVWFLNALVVGTSVAFGDVLLEIYNKGRARFAVPVVVLAAGLFAATLTLITPLLGGGEVAGSENWATRLGQRLELYSLTMDGRAFYSLITNSPLDTPSLVNPVTAVALIAAVLGVVWLVFLSFRNGRVVVITFGERFALTSLVILVLVFAQIVMTRDATGPHHIDLMYPFHHFLALSIAGSAVRRLTGNLRRALTTLAGLAFVALVCSQLVAGMAYYSAFRSGQQFDPKWSPAIYQLADYANHSSADVIISADWGIGTQVYALAPDQRHEKYFDLWPDFRNLDIAQGGRKLYDSYFRNKTALVLVHADTDEVMKGSRANFLTFAVHYLRSVRLAKLVTDSNGRVIFEVYEVSG